MSASESLGPQFKAMRKMGLPYEIQHETYDNYGEELDHYQAKGPPEPHPDLGPEVEHRPHYGSLFVRREGNKPVIMDLEVDDDYQGEGIGTALYHHAQAHLGETVYHDDVMTSQGREWAKKVGGPRFGDPKTWARIEY